MRPVSAAFRARRPSPALTSMLLCCRLVCPRHPENAFFEQFANALIYENPHEFSEQLAHALANDPPPLTDDDHRCGWYRARAIRHCTEL